jgi:predicted RNA-binding Zn-ribbon protein involved in translation (DUF1610 family)
MYVIVAIVIAIIITYLICTKAKDNSYGRCYKCGSEDILYRDDLSIYGDNVYVCMDCGAYNVDR